MGNKIDQKIKEDEAKRLADLIGKANYSSHTDFAKKCKVPGGKSMLSQHINAIRPVSLECAIAYVSELSEPLEAISPRLAELVQRIPAKSKLYANATPINRLSAHEPDNVALFPARDFAPTVLEIAKVAETMNRDGQMMLLGQAKLLASSHQKDKGNTG